MGGLLSRTLLHMNRVAKSAFERSSTALPRICLVVAAILVMAPAAHAATGTATWVLPVPDGGDVNPSTANLEGRIVRVGHGFIEVTPPSRRPIHVSHTGKTGLYSAFGGDYDPCELAVGQHVAPWFVGCEPEARQATAMGTFSALHGRRFDAVIDCSGYRPHQVMRSAAALRGGCPAARVFLTMGRQRSPVAATSCLSRGAAFE